VTALKLSLKEWLRHPIRRFRARHWRCRCGKRVFDNAALGSHPLAPATPNSNCHWHLSVRMQVMRGKIRKAADAR
jgi:hypothetical protein